MTGRPFDYDTLMKLLKSWGRTANFPNWSRFGSQGWRRGVAADRARKAAPSEEILAAGDWAAKSKAYVRYIRSAYGHIGAKAAALAFVQEESDADD